MENLKRVFSALVISLLVVIFAYMYVSILYHLNFLEIIEILGTTLISYRIIFIIAVGLVFLIPLILKIYYYIVKKERIEPGDYRLEDIIENED